MTELPYFGLGASASASRVDPARIMEVCEEHAETVTLSFLIDLAKALNLRLRTAIVDCDK